MTFSLFYNVVFTPENFYRILEKYRVTNFAWAPTAYRAIMAAENELAEKTDMHLRVASNAGEPLNPKLISWSEEVWGVPIHDHFGQTELGMADDIIISSGYRIGPFEVESALIQHEAVAECAVTGKPDELRGEIVKAFVVLNSGYTPPTYAITIITVGKVQEFKPLTKPAIKTQA